MQSARCYSHPYNKQRSLTNHDIFLPTLIIQQDSEAIQNMSGVYSSVSGVNIDERKRFRADRCIFYNFSESKNVIKIEQYKIHRKKRV